MDTMFRHTRSTFYSFPPYSLPWEADLCGLQWAPLLSGLQLHLAVAAWAGHHKEVRDQRIDSLTWIPVRLPPNGSIPPPKVTAPLKTLLSTLLSSFGFQQPHPFHILWARDSNNPTVTSIGTLHSPCGFSKPNLVFVKMLLLNASNYANVNVAFASCWDSFATSNVILRF